MQMCWIFDTFLFFFKLLLYLFDFLCFSFILFIYSHLSFHWSSESMWKLGTIKPTKLQLGRSLFVRVYFFFRGKQGRERVSTWGLAALTSTESLLRWLWAQHLLCSFCHVWSSMLDDGKSPMFVGSFFSLLYSNRIAPLTQMCSLKIHCEFATLFFAASSFEVCCFSFKSCQKQKSTRANGENVMANWMDAIIPKDGGENHENDFHGNIFRFVGCSIHAGCVQCACPVEYTTYRHLVAYFMQFHGYTGINRVLLYIYWDTVECCFEFRWKSCWCAFCQHLYTNS